MRARSTPTPRACCATSPAGRDGGPVRVLGGQTDKVAHLSALRFALIEPGIDTTSIDNAAFALEERCCFVHRVGSDGLRIGYQPTLKKVVNDRRASLDEEKELKPAMRKLVEEEFRRGAGVPVIAFPVDSAGCRRHQS